MTPRKPHDTERRAKSSLANEDCTDIRVTSPPSGPQHIATYWSAFATTIVLLLILSAWWIHVPGQDHFASIPLNGDGTWFYNYEAKEIQDTEILSHGIGHSIQSAQQADIILLGSSRLLFGIDWRVFEGFERKQRLKIFNLGMAGIGDGELSLRIIRKYKLHPKLWIINAERDLPDALSSFFFVEYSPDPPFRNWKNPNISGTGISARAIAESKAEAIKNVIGRNIRWHLKMAAGSLKGNSYRSAKTGNWYLDHWPNYASDKNATIKPLELRAVDGAFHQTERGSDFACPVIPQEVEDAKRYTKAIGGAVVLIQVPSAFACAQRVHELATAIGVPSFTVEPTQFTSTDGGGHLDGISARKYSTMLFRWLQQLPEFQRLFGNKDIMRPTQDTVPAR